MASRQRGGRRGAGEGPSPTAAQPGDGAAGRKHPLAALDPLLHAPARLMIVTHLFVVEAADAVFLKGMTGLTWGNLSSHLRKLEEAGYTAVEKTFDGRKPRTVISLTAQGREALLAYRAAMLQGLEPLEG